MRHTKRKSTGPKLLSIKVSAAVSAKVVRLAKERHTTISAVVRDAIERLDEGSSKASFGEKAASAFGVFEGPSDLSTNPKHLVGFGTWRR